MQQPCGILFAGSRVVMATPTGITSRPTTSSVFLVFLHRGVLSNRRKRELIAEGFEERYEGWVPRGVRALNEGKGKNGFLFTEQSYHHKAISRRSDTDFSFS